MQPSKIDNSQSDLFSPRLSNILNPRHEMMVLEKMVNWDELEQEFADCYLSNYSKGGCPPKPIRLMVGLLLLQHMHSLSDELVVERWVENPYWQYFCGFDLLQWKMPIDPSSLTRFRNRIGEVRMEKILSLTIYIALQSKFVDKKELKKVIVDTTVMPKNIEYPTDSKLYEKSRIRIIKLCQKHNVPLRQNYNQVCKKINRRLGGYLHAKQMKRARKEIKSLKTILGRIIRDVERKTTSNIDLAQIFKPELELATKLLNQQIKDKNKIYALHEPDVVCISKGKSRNRYEFGSKVSLVMTHKKSLITSSQSLDNNPYDGHTLKSALTNAQEITQTKIDDAFVDKGYKGHGIDEEEDNIRIFISGKRTHNGKKLTKTLKKHLKRRQAIEPIIGHMKNDGKLNLSRLKGVIGDKINAVLAACGHNLRMILKHLRKLLKNPFFVSFLAFFTAFLREIMGFYQEFKMKFLVLEFEN
jgi:IS5 family transposase